MRLHDQILVLFVTVIYKNSFPDKMENYELDEKQLGMVCLWN